MIFYRMISPEGFISGKAFPGGGVSFLPPNIHTNQMIEHLHHKTKIYNIPSKQDNQRCQSLASYNAHVTS